MSFFHEKMDHFSRNKKDGILKITPFCSKECAESIGTEISFFLYLLSSIYPWTLATSNVKIIDPIYIFQNGRFLAKKVIFLENGWSDRAQNWCVDARDDFGKMNFEKGGSIKYSFFQRKLPRPSPQREEKQCKVETFWCEINILKESTLENFTSLDYKSE